MMNRLATTVVAIILGLASFSAQGVTAKFGIRLGTDIGGAQEVIDTTIAPGVTLPVTGLVTAGLGEAHFRLSPDGTSLSYTLKVSVMPGTPIFMAHIHLGPRGRNGPIILWLFGDPSNNPLPITLPRDDGPFTGEISGMLTAADLFPQPGLGLDTFEEAVKNILASNAYVNVHTVAHPPGELRGQIHREIGITPAGLGLGLGP